MKNSWGQLTINLFALDELTLTDEGIRALQSGLTIVMGGLIIRAETAQSATPPDGSD